MATRVRVCSRSWILGIAILLVANSRLSAQVVQPESWNITPFLGFTFGGGPESDIIDTDSSWAVGVAVAYDYTQQITFEGELGYVPDLIGDDEDFDLSYTTFSGNLLYHFTTAEIFPYGTLGIGVSRQHLSLPGPENDESDADFAVNFGGGVKLPFSDRAGFRADLRYFSVPDDDDFWRLYGGVTFRLRQ